MNSEIKDWVEWAQSQGWTVEDDTKGYTRFYNPEGDYIGNYPATPGNAHRRLLDLRVNLKKAGLQIPPPSKKEQRSQARKASKAAENEEGK